MNRVVVTGVGIYCPLGNGIKYVWNRLVESSCGIINCSELPDRFKYASIPCQVVGVVPRGIGVGEFNESDFVLASERRMVPQYTVYALATAREALEDAKLLDVYKIQKKELDY